jgi:nucleoid-associated protein YgaU
MRSESPTRRGPSRACCLWFSIVLYSSLFPATFLASAQDVAEAARQERSRKAGQTQQQATVYTDDDLKRPQILNPEDRERVAARKKDPAFLPNSQPTQSLESSGASSTESLAEIARRYRREKTAREVEHSFAADAPFAFPMGLSPAPLAAMAPARVGPLSPPMLPAKTEKLGVAFSRRDPFSRPTLAPALASSAADSKLGSMAPAKTRAVLRVSLPDLRPIAPASREGRITIQSGDSLWKLARHYLGRGSRWQEWLNSNPALLDPKVIRPGMTLLVPRTTPLTLARPPSSVSIRTGESLWKIAQALFGSGTEWPCLARANPGLRDAHHIYAGQSLAIPTSCLLTP